MAIIPDVEGEAWNEQRQLLELAVKHAVTELWRFAGACRVSLPVPSLGLVVTIEPAGPASGEKVQ